MKTDYKKKYLKYKLKYLKLKQGGGMNTTATGGTQPRLYDPSWVSAYKDKSNTEAGLNFIRMIGNSVNYWNKSSREAEEEARIKAEKEEEEARINAEKEEEEARINAEKEARINAEKEARIKAEKEEARIKAEKEEARIKAEEERPIYEKLLLKVKNILP